MTHRPLVPLVFALLACLSAQAAPKKKHAAAPAKAAASQPVAPQDIDVDALARAKDGKPTEPLAEPAAAPSATEAPVATEGTAPTDAASRAVEEAAQHAATAADEAAPAEPPAMVAGEAAAEPVATSVEAARAATGTEAAASSPDGTPEAATDAQATRPSPLAPPSAPDAAEKTMAAACEARATSLLDAAQKGDYAGATRDFDAKMRSALPAPKFKQAWESLAQFGQLQARGQTHPMKGDGYIAITIPLIFDKANLYAQVACGSDGRIAGFYVKPL
ncbi:DUF3887 domain-containing protein [Dokdonella fugitiva]|jgi:hypothetical protein|uniref:Uncharacterized protein DUF3887 n=1 Tax=Dokdonella fugitiva TaxID=328517 RepID=A0A4R2IAI7_9GAMM|nr:DUF3887 domain-containing protein [Dokdonella fugitiva]MBA8883134.1 hypothetical protein [Dokdonella fugitiva]TCO40408.1 uncharacterized protein DUF3887 [Dokdonella fugitiva]